MVFCSAHDEAHTNTDLLCPCIRSDDRYILQIPPFINGNYFCATGSRGLATPTTFYVNDPLWDGKGCGATSMCCQFNNLPWFCRKLTRPTDDDIELRICANSPSGGEDNPIEIVDLFVS